MTNFYEKNDDMTENFNTRLLARFGMQDITPPPPPPLGQADSHLRPPFAYPKPPFAAAKRWRPPHPSLILFAMMFMSACGGGGGGSPASTPTEEPMKMDNGDDPMNGKEPPMGPILPTGLFLRPTGEGNVRVYSEGESVTGTGDDAKLAEETEGVLAEEADGSTEPVIIGRFAHDSLVPSENKSGIPDLAVTYSLVANPGEGYSNAMFSITDDTLSYIGANSGDYESDPRPTHKLKIVADVTIVIRVPDISNFGDAYYVSADDTQGGNGGVEYAYSVGTIRKTDVAAGVKQDGMAASATFTNAASSGTGEDVLIITAKDTGEYANGIKVVIEVTSTVSVGSFSLFRFEEDTQRFTIIYGRKNTEDVNLTLNELIDSFNNFPLEKIKSGTVGTEFALEELTHLIKGNTGTFADIFTITKAENADGESKAFHIQDTLSLTDGVDEITETIPVSFRQIDVPAGEIYLGDGSVIQFVAANNLRIDADSYVIVTDIVTDADGDGMGTVKVVAALPSPSDGKFYIIGEVKPYGEADPTQTGAKQSANSEIELSQTNEYDYVINLKDIDETNTPAESLPSAAEAVPATDDDPAAPEAEATKPSIGRRILDYLFGSQEEHRQMQNQQMENMFGDSDLDPINPQDPDIL